MSDDSSRYHLRKAQAAERKAMRRARLAEQALDRVKVYTDREQRAVAAAAGMFTRPPGTVPYQDSLRWKGGFGVESDSVPGQYYTVSFDTAQGCWVCSCKGCIHWGRCKHLKRYGYAGRAEKPQPTPTFAPAPAAAKALPPMPRAMIVTTGRRFAKEGEV